MMYGDVWEYLVHEVCRQDAGSALALRKVDKLTKETVDRVIWKWENEERHLCHMLNACCMRCNRSPWRWLLQTWAVEHESPITHEEVFTPMYKCAMCGGQVHQIGGCRECRRRARRYKPFPWVSTFAGPTLAACVAVAVILLVTHLEMNNFHY